MKYQVYLSKNLDSLVNEEFLFEADAMSDILPRLSKAIKDNTSFGDNPYWRFMSFPIGVSIDFGSWSQFLIITNATMEDFY